MCGLFVKKIRYIIFQCRVHMESFMVNEVVLIIEVLSVV